MRHVVQGWHVAQLHPRDMGGSSVELDGLHDRGRWFWDVLDVDRPVTSAVDDVVAVDVAATEPEALMARWATVFGLDADTASNTLSLGARLVRFVPQVHGCGHRGRGPARRRRRGSRIVVRDGERDVPPGVALSVGWRR